MDHGYTLAFAPDLLFQLFRAARFVMAGRSGHKGFRRENIFKGSGLDFADGNDGVVQHIIVIDRDGRELQNQVTGSLDRVMDQIRACAMSTFTGDVDVKSVAAGKKRPGLELDLAGRNRTPDVKADDLVNTAVFFQVVQNLADSQRQLFCRLKEQLYSAVKLSL